MKFGKLSYKIHDIWYYNHIIYHRPKHLRPEHAAVADFGPLLELRVVPEDLHRGLRVRVVRRLEAHSCNANLLEEGPDCAYQVT